MDSESARSPSPVPFLPVDGQTAIRIDDLCDQFEAAWDHGDSPPLEPLLNDVPPGARTALLAELLRIEISHHLQQGQTLDIVTLSERFPEHLETVSAVANEFDHAAKHGSAPQLPLSVSQVQETIGGLKIVSEAAQRRLAEIATAYHDTPGPAAASSLLKVAVNETILTQHQADMLLTNRGIDLVFDNYVIQSRLGQGGMAHVYLARHQVMERDVAMKMLRPRLSDTAAGIDRFQQEIRTLARLDHPNIVVVYDAQVAGDRAFLVMELVDGVDLDTHIKQHGPLPVDEAIHVVRQVVDAMSYAHEQGIIHRDIKPANLMLTSSNAIKVLDLGLANVEHIVEEDQSLSEWGDGEDTDHRLTQTDMVIGTPHFIAPEQAVDPRNSTPQSDIYSLGCTLYFLVTGEHMFPGRSRVRTIQHHQTSPRPALQSSAGVLPHAVTSVYERMVAIEQATRFESMEEVDLALAQALHGGGGWLSRLGRTKLARTLGILMVVLMLGAAISLWSGIPSSLDTKSRDKALPGLVENSIGMPLVSIPAGRFMMGSRPDVSSPERLNESPIHPVEISRPFLLGRHEVTRGEFGAVMGRAPTFDRAGSTRPPPLGDPDGDKLPVSYVTWEEAIQFCRRLSQDSREVAAGRRYRLPTEAEWEYACRATTSSAYCYGMEPRPEHMHADRHELGPVAVESYSPNGWGLYDMHGNVAEWVADRYVDRYAGPDLETDPTGPGPGVASVMVIRGGGWRDRFVDCFDMWTDYKRRVHSSFGVEVNTEGDGVTRYWQPKQAGIEGFVRFRYHFHAPIIKAQLWGNLLQLGNTSMSVLEVARATGGNQEMYHEVLRGTHEDIERASSPDATEFLTGCRGVFVQARLKVEKGENAYMSQFLRSAPARHFSFPAVYQFIVELDTSDCRSAVRRHAPATFRDEATGFRVVCEYQ